MTKPIRPKKLSIEPSTICQLRCADCSLRFERRSKHFGKGYLKFQDFKNLLDRTPRIKFVYFQSIGEMFLNPELQDMLSYCFSTGRKVSMAAGANLNYLGDGMAEALVKFHVRDLTCAIDGVTDKIYRIYRVGGHLEQVLANVREINRYKEIYQSKYPQLTWQFVVFGHNEHELPMARKLANDLGMRFQAKMAWNSNFSPIVNPQFVMAETGWKAVTREKIAEITGKHYGQGMCYELWTVPRVNWDGRVFGCCGQKREALGGNVFRDGYFAACNTERIKYARQMLLGQVEPRADIPCTTCPVYQVMSDTGNYLTANEIQDPTKLRWQVDELLSQFAWFWRVKNAYWRIKATRANR